MKAATRDWIKKAESDWLLAVSLLASSLADARAHLDRRYAAELGPLPA